MGAVFIGGAAAFSSIGAVLIEHRVWLMRVGGILVIAMALAFLGQGPQRAWQPRWRPAAGLAGAPLLGAVFGIGWSPCMGPTLGTVLTLATATGDQSAVTRGVILATAYCLGLGLPFLGLAVGYSRLSGLSKWLRQHHRAVQALGGTLLLITGLLLVTGAWDTVTTTIQARLISGFTTIL